MKSFLLSIGACVVLFCPQGQAFAHATPVEYEPLESAVLEGAPTAIRIRFSERVEPRASGITVFAPNGSSMLLPSTVDPNEPRTLQAPFALSSSGTYTVSWQVVSADDGHFTKGAYAFSVGQPSGSGDLPPFQLVHRSANIEAFTIWLELLGQALLLGTIAVYALIGRMLKKHAGIDARLMRRLYVTFLVVGVLCIIGGAVSYLLLKAINLQADRQDTFWTSFTLFLGTLAGRATFERLLLGIVFLLSFLGIQRVWKAQTMTRLEWLWLVLIAVMALLRARVSHAAATGNPILAVGINWIHLLGKEMWIGGVPAFLFLCLPVLLRLRDRALHAKAVVLFGRLLCGAFAVGALTGVYVVWLHLKGFANVGATHWGMQFVALTSIAAVLLALRLYQHFVVHPELAGRRQSTTPLPETLSSSWIALTAEAATGFVVLFLSSSLIITTPPLNAGERFTRVVTDQGVRITLAENADDASSLLLSFSKSEVVPVVTLENTVAGIGPIVVPLSKVFEGGFVLQRSLLSPAGPWAVHVTAQRQGAYDANARFDIYAPYDLTSPSEIAHSPVLTLLSWGLLFFFALAALFLLGQNRRVGRAAESASGDYAVLPLPFRLRTFLVALPIITVPILFLATQLQAHGHGGLQSLCKKNGHLWHESVPMREGRVTSGTASMGCMFGSGKGQFHFSDVRQYAYFNRPAAAIASMNALPVSPRPGVPTSLTFAIRDAAGKPIEDLVAEHDRFLHVAIVSDDLQTFSHVHPEDLGPITDVMLRDSTFTVRHTFPHPGRYLIAADFTVRSHLFAQEFYVTVPGETPAESSVAPVLSGIFDGYDVRLVSDHALVSGKPIRLTYEISQEGKPIADLESYLSAPMHLFFARSDLRASQHNHALLPQSFYDRLLTPRTPNKHEHIFLPERFGSPLEALLQFPSPGSYVVFGEFKHRGKVVVTKFVVEVH